MFAQMLVLTTIFLGWGLYAFVIRPLADMPVQLQVPMPLQATEDELRATVGDFMRSVQRDPSDVDDITQDPFIREVEARNPDFRFYIRVGNRAFGNGPPAFFRRFGFDAVERVQLALADPSICTQGEKIMKRRAGDDYLNFIMCKDLRYFEYRNLRHPVIIEPAGFGPRGKWLSAFSGNFLLAAGGVFLIFALIFTLHIGAIRRVARLARSIDPQRLDALLPEKGVASEILPLVRAVNHLIGQVNAAQRRATFFLSAAAHEMRTPLAVLRTRLELMEDGQQKDKLVGDVRRLTRLVNQLLTLMSIGNRRDVTGFCDLVASAAKVIADRAPVAEQADVTLMLDSDTESFEVPGDATLIESAIANLVDNAISFAPARTTVRLFVAADGRITVRDHGPGFGDMDPETLFEPFARPVSSRRGYGLGLAIVAAIVRLHGGIWSARNAEDGGGEFSVTFAA
ncbi:HAMP domain-containing sensor histidine kinase [Sphingomonas sp.]|uniref:sensor histidine kinase n=1 Tax=Sphingomonas sp. TaxID=28214 RepID=UPI0031DFD83E